MELITLIHNADIRVLDFFDSLDGGALLDKTMVFLSVICNHGEVWLSVAVILLLFKKTRMAGLAALAAIGFSFVLVEGALKNLIDRPRPYVSHLYIVPLLDKLTSSSFPSGHSAQSFAFSIPLLYYFRAPAAPFLVLATLIAFSRLYLCMHYLSDVVAGSLIGTLVGVLAVLLFKYGYSAPNTGNNQDSA